MCVLKCVIFRFRNYAAMYLYIPLKDDQETSPDDLPEGLEKLTGKLEKVMELELTSERKLARVNVEDVMTSLTEKGFYIQMPPNNILRKDDSMLYDPSDSF